MLCYHRKLNRTWCHFGTADVFCTVHGAMRNSIDLGSSKSSRFSVLCCGVMSNSVGCRIQQATLLYFLYSCHIMLLLLNHFSCVQLFVTPCTAACQAPLSMGFSSKNTGMGCHALLQGIFPTQGSNVGLPHCEKSHSWRTIGQFWSKINFLKNSLNFWVPDWTYYNNKVFVAS